MQISAQRLRPVGAINEERLGAPGNGLQIPSLVSCIRFKITDGHFECIHSHGFAQGAAAECLQCRKIGQRRVAIKDREIRRCAWLLVHLNIIADRAHRCQTACISCFSSFKQPLSRKRLRKNSWRRPIVCGLNTCASSLFLRKRMPSEINC